MKIVLKLAWHSLKWLFRLVWAGISLAFIYYGLGITFKREEKIANDWADMTEEEINSGEHGSWVNKHPFVCDAAVTTLADEALDGWKWIVS